MGIGWRLLWGVVGAGLTATVLTVWGLGLTPPVLIGASIGGGVLTAALGPVALEWMPFI